jgi:putative membrane protein
LISISSPHNENNKSIEEVAMMNWYGNGSGWMGGGTVVFMGLFWILLIGLGIWLVTWLTRREKPAELPENPRQMLDRRFATGEIDSTQYAQARRLIDNRVSSAGETPKNNSR